MISKAEAFLAPDCNSVTAPVTCGEAILVPLICSYSLVAGPLAEWIPPPGASKNRLLGRLLKDEIAPSGSNAPTERKPGKPSGNIKLKLTV
jgi:hypothetical protein